MAKLPGAARALDPRLLIGVLLVIASAAGVFAIVTASDRSVSVFAARETLLPGERLTSEDLVRTAVRDDDTASLYLDEVPEDGLVVVRTGRPEPAEVVASIRARFPVHAVLAPEPSPAADRVVPDPGLVATVAGFEVHVSSVTPVLEARIGRGPGVSPARR